ncbi:MAG: HAMP domain-containing sensor histidine kinase [Polyangiaceae bacterium]
MSTTKPRKRLGYRRIVTLLVSLIIVPTGLLMTLGIILMFLGEAQANLLVGMLTVSFMAVVVTGVVLVWVFVRKEAYLSELQSDFVSKVSHELRTPLTAIRLFAETLERSGDDRVTREKCIVQINKESERLKSLIERLLDWGRMEAGRKLYDLRKESFEAIAIEAVSTFAPERYEDLEFEAAIATALPPVLVDRAAMIDAIGNLLSNARKYGGTPGKVSVVVQKNAQGAVCLRVTDNGEGIPREEQRRIFEKFYRIDDRLSRVREGSGLGLSIVQHIVRAHNGRVEVESSPGAGSTFTIVLPPIVGEEEPKSDASQTPAP